jgi:aspartate dehydrogenase
VTRNVHRVEVESDSARFSMSIENIPSENPKTGRITALSVIAYLRKQGAALCVGT